MQKYINIVWTRRKMRKPCGMWNVVVLGHFRIHVECFWNVVGRFLTLLGIFLFGDQESGPTPFRVWCYGHLKTILLRVKYKQHIHTYVVLAQNTRPVDKLDHVRLLTATENFEAFEVADMGFLIFAEGDTCHDGRTRLQLENKVLWWCVRVWRPPRRLVIGLVLQNIPKTTCKYTSHSC